jgi:hypothetical protein
LRKSAGDPLSDGADGTEGPAGGQRRHEIGDPLHHEPRARRRAEPSLVAPANQPVVALCLPPDRI